MNFSSLVLMEKDTDTGYLTNELGSYEVGDNAEYIVKLNCENNIVNLYFDTKKDVEEWEYSAIYDCFDESIFIRAGYEIESCDEEYNPTWIIKLPYDDEYSVMHKKLNELCNIIENEMLRVFEAIKDKEEEYKGVSQNYFKK